MDRKLVSRPPWLLAEQWIMVTRICKKGGLLYYVTFNKQVRKDEIKI